MHANSLNYPLVPSLSNSFYSSRPLLTPFLPSDARPARSPPAMASIVGTEIGAGLLAGWSVLLLLMITAAGGAIFILIFRSRKQATKHAERMKKLEAKIVERERLARELDEKAKQEYAELLEKKNKEPEVKRQLPEELVELLAKETAAREEERKAEARKAELLDIEKREREMLKRADKKHWKNERRQREVDEGNLQRPECTGETYKGVRNDLFGVTQVYDTKETTVASKRQQTESDTRGDGKEEEEVDDDKVYGRIPYTIGYDSIRHTVWKDRDSYSRMGMRYGTERCGQLQYPI
ncbi:hypothetical protein PFISCL1PPCAC_16422 [Pristionchus fissidentatus]|uniref:Uncharacterized protein n=1 Tax=Pristionchus fissidentatus TaxID=1538716 RepID=A0AAV5W470_9BILA|nr:hypothetical protein PFISCL1PPCAC_16422 [Pristionchus fissidentatus]